MPGRAELQVEQLVEVLCADGSFTLQVGGTGLEAPLRHRTIQRLGVDLTGYTEHMQRDRVQMLGRSEAGYLATLSAEERDQHLEEIADAGLGVLVITAGQTPQPLLLTLAASHGFALLTTALESTEATARINAVLHHHLRPRGTRHGVLVDVYGVGVLVVGKSGIGKSEVGLELVTRGHRLVADDLVRIEQESPNSIIGACPELTRHHMEIRGLGIINIRDLFGAAAVRDQKRIELVVELVEWQAGLEFDRLGLDTRYMELAGVPIKHITLPVRPGRSLTLIIEVAARNRLLEAQGTHSAQAFAERLDNHIAGRGSDL